MYVWVNAYKRIENYYEPADIEMLRRVDPYFDWNRERYPSLGKPCGAGATSFTVDGQGDVRRCHFIDKTIGNLYQDDIFDRLGPSPCSNSSCGCHIGYVHRPELQLEKLYGPGLLERIPATWPEHDQRYTRESL